MSTPGPAASCRRHSSQRLPDAGPPRIEHIDPRDGAEGVFRDACVMARLSSPADPATLSADTFSIEDHTGVVPAQLRMSADRLVLIWTAERLLVPGVAHVIRAEGLRDTRGRPLAPHRSQFTPCDLTSTDWPA